jgi:8-oxo-dGTP pyrophosphatase MutT (NUDIX family)
VAIVQYGAIPFRKKKGAVRLLLITTRRKGRWSVPKGWPIRKKSASGTAAQEAFEEAGLVGKVTKRPVGQFTSRKLRKNRVQNCRVKLYPFRVKKQKRNWPEMNQRRTRWVTPDEAQRLIHRAALRDIVAAFTSRT